MRRFLIYLIIFLVCTLTYAQIPKAEILWDNWGVPHIYADTEEALFYAWGWAQMRAHTDTLLEVYGRVRGRGAEYFGERYLESDRYIHQMGLPQLVAELSQVPTTDITTDAFVKGINDFAYKRLDEIESSRRQVLPITPEDILALSLYDQFFTGNYVTPEAVAEMRQQFLDSGSIRDPGSEIPIRASNAWVLAPSKTTSGHTILLSNTHIPWPTLKGLEFFRWMETHLVGPDLNFYGIGLIGLPALNLGFNEYLGWTFTSAPTFDFIDAYELTLQENGYLFDGAVQPFETYQNKLKIRQDDGSFREEIVTGKFSIHGPVIAEKSDKALAIAFPKSTPESLEASTKQLWALPKAKTLDEFLDALKPQTMLASNLLYADRQGNILYALAGLFPKRPEGYDWSGTLPGNTSRALWQGYLPFEVMPVVQNPATGYLQSANEPPYFVTLPSGLEVTQFPKDWPVPDVWPRTRRSLALITSQERFSFEDVMRLKFDTHSDLADRVLDTVITVGKQYGSPEAQEAVQVLENWDRNFDANSVGAVVFAFWAMHYNQNILGGGRFPPDAFAVPFDPAKPLETPTGLTDPGKAVEALEFATQAVKQTFGSLQVPWGVFYNFRVDDTTVPGFGAPAESFGVFSPNFAAPQDDGVLATVAGDSWITVIEFADIPKVMAVLPFGNVSKHSGVQVDDQLSLYSNKQYRSVWFTRVEVMSHLTIQEMLSLNK